MYIVVKINLTRQLQFKLIFGAFKTLNQNLLLDFMISRLFDFYFQSQIKKNFHYLLITLIYFSI